MNSLCLCIHGCPVYYGNEECSTLEGRETKNKANNRLNAEQDVFVCVCICKVGGVPIQPHPNLGEDVEEGKDSMKSLLCHGKPSSQSIT